MTFWYIKEHWTTIFVYLILIFLIVVVGITNDLFLSVRNIQMVLLAAVALGLVSFGQTFAILSEGIDLSVGSVISLTTCLTAGIINGRDQMVVPVVALTIGVALLIGFGNGFLIVKTGVSPLIVTLGMMSIVQGAALIYAIGPVGEISPAYYFLAWGKVGTVPFPILIFGIVTAILIYVLKRTAFGRYVYAIGGNEEVARLSGIHTDRIKIYVYMLSSFMAALCGLFLTSRMGMGEPVVGEHFMFQSIVPVLVGGTSFLGGVGGIVGTLGGVLILTVLQNTVNLFGISTYWLWIVEGGIIVTAAAFYLKEKF